MSRSRLVARSTGALLLIVGLVDGALPVTGSLTWPLRLICALVGAVTVVLVRRPPPPRRPSSTARTPARLSDQQIYDYTNKAWKRFDDIEARAASMQNFIDLLTKGKAVRAKETVEILGDALKSVAELEIRPSDAIANLGDSRVVVPFLRRKAQAFDRIEVCGTDGKKLTLLPPEIIYGLLSYTVMTLFRTYITQREDDIDEAESEALYAITRLVCHDDRMDETIFEAEFENVIDRLPGVEAAKRKKLLDICLYFAESTVVAVETAGPVDRLSVSFEYLITPPGRLATREDVARAVFGLPPFRYRVPLAWFFYTERYDLRFQGPGAQFVYRHGLAFGRGARLATEDDLGSWTRSAAQIRVYINPDVGLAHSDLTIVNGRQAPVTYVECVVEIEEIPPGALGRALLISAVCTVLLFTFAFVVPHTPGSGNLGALLIALPAFAATWVGLSADRIQQSSLTAVGGLAVTGLASVTGSVLYLMQAALWGNLSMHGITVLTLVPLPTFDPPWLALGSLSAAVTALLAVRWRHRMNRYLETLRRRDAVLARPTDRAFE